MEIDRKFQNPECAINAVHIQAVIQALAFISSIVILYVISAIILFCIIAFDLAPDELLGQTLLVLSLFGLSPLGLALVLWRLIEALICKNQYRYAKKYLKY